MAVGGSEGEIWAWWVVVGEDGVRGEVEDDEEDEDEEVDVDEGVVVDLGKVVDGFGLGWVVMYSCARVIWFCMSLSMVVDPCVWTCVALTEPGWSPGGLAPMSKSILK